MNLKDAWRVSKNPVRHCEISGFGRFCQVYITQYSVWTSTTLLTEALTRWHNDYVSETGYPDNERRINVYYWKWFFPLSSFHLFYLVFPIVTSFDPHFLFSLFYFFCVIWFFTLITFQIIYCFFKIIFLYLWCVFLPCILFDFFFSQFHFLIHDNK